MHSSSVVLAQALGRPLEWSQVSGILVTSGIMIAFLILVLLVYTLFFKKAKSPSSGSIDDGFSLSSLREMAERGEISPEEYETLKAKIIARFKKSADYQNIPPLKRPSIPPPPKVKGKSSESLELPVDESPSFEALDDTPNGLPSTVEPAVAPAAAVPLSASHTDATTAVTSDDQSPGLTAEKPRDSASTIPADAQPTPGSPSAEPAPQPTAESSTPHLSATEMATASNAEKTLDAPKA